MYLVEMLGIPSSTHHLATYVMVALQYVQQMLTMAQYL